MNEQATPVIEVSKLKTYLGDSWVHDGLDLSVQRKEIIGLVGGSGTGKTTLLREILMLQKVTSGSIKVFGKEIVDCSEVTAGRIRQRWGVMFQHGALFSSLTLLENVVFPLREHTSLTAGMMNEIAMLKILMVGLPADAATKYPVELSGGMVKRAALARAIVLDPELLFLDEPTAGLDPQGAHALDELVLSLRDTLGLTVFMITHDLDTLWQTTDRVAFLGKGVVLGFDTVEALAKASEPMIKKYFTGPRGRAAAKA